MNLEESIAKVESLFETVTGQPAPPVSSATHQLPENIDLELIMERQIERLIRLLEDPIFNPRVMPWNPPISIWENQNEISIRVELAGVSKKDVDISVKGNLLTVSGERKIEKFQQGYHCRTKEFCFGPFQRTILLPAGITTAEVHSKMTDGMLEISIPRVAKNEKGTAVQ